MAGLDPRLADPMLLRLAGLRLHHRARQATGPPAWHAAVRERLRILHPEQVAFVNHPAKRKVVRAGRRSGKTTGVATLAVCGFLAGRRILYAVPTQEQVERFWFEVKRALEPAIDANVLYKNETRHLVELPGTETRIRAKTAWDPDSLRGDYADLLILDEHQLMSEDAWGLVGAPMLLDNNGDAVLSYTPVSLRAASQSKATDKRHAAKLFQAAQLDTTGRWQTFHFTSHANPYLSTEALDLITSDMSALAHRQEIMAEDVEELEGALWTLRALDAGRVARPPAFTRIVVGLDPGQEAGIVVVAKGEDGHGYVLEDLSIRGAPDTWAHQAIAAYHKYRADAIIAERNHGGEMVETVITHTDRFVNVKTVWASHGKYARAEPISALYAQGKVHHVGVFPALEDEMCMWLPLPGVPSPNRMDAVVWGVTDLLLGPEKRPAMLFDIHL